MGQMRTIPVTASHSIDCYEALPAAGAGAPVIIVIQEWWGLNAQIKGVVDRVAAAGFVGIAPDLFHGRIAATGDEASHMMQGLDFPAALGEIGAVLDDARKPGQPVGITGFCMGGAITFSSAARLPGLTTAVPFYGIPSPKTVDLATIRIPVQAHFASHDDWCNPQEIARVDAALGASGVPYEIHLYDAQHAFTNEARPEVYNAEATALAWKRAMDWFGSHLG